MSVELAQSVTQSPATAPETPFQPRSLRLAYCLPVLRQADSPEASFQQQMYIAGGLGRRGHRVTFLAPQDQSDVVAATDLQSHSVVRRTWSRARWFDLAGRLAWRGQRLLGIPYLNVFSNLRLYDAYLQSLPGHDIVQERNGLYRAAVARACKRLRLPYVLFFDGDDIFEHDLSGDPIVGVLRWRARQMVRYNLAAADRVICVAERMKARLVEVWQVQPAKIEVFPNGVDTDIYRPRPEERERMRAALNLGSGPVILFVGGFYPWHDVPTLFEAFRLVCAQHADATLVMVGDGAQRPAAAQLAQDLGLAAQIRFTGAVPQQEVPRLLAAADVAVAPYTKIDSDLFWGSSMKVFEYMAAGTPLIASALGQITEVIQDGVNGLLVMAGEVEDLTSALRRLIGDPALRSRLALRAREDAVNKHSWERYVERLESVYEQVLSDHGGVPVRAGARTS